MYRDEFTDAELNRAFWELRSYAQLRIILDWAIEMCEKYGEPMPAELKRTRDCRKHIGIYAQTNTEHVIHEEDYGKSAVVQSEHDAALAGDPRAASAQEGWWTGPAKAITTAKDDASATKLYSG